MATTYNSTILCEADELPKGFGHASLRSIMPANYIMIGAYPDPIDSDQDHQVVCKITNETDFAKISSRGATFFSVNPIVALHWQE